MDFKNFSDEDLVSLLRSSNEAAMAEIYNRYWRKLLALAYNHTKDKSSAQEIVQEIMIKLWDRREQYHIESLERYLAIAVRYSVYNFVCREKRRAQIALENVPTIEIHHDDEVIYAQFLQQHINGIVEGLPEKCQLVFKYSRVEGKSIRQISTELEISEKTVEAHLTKALKSLRFYLRHAGWLTIFIYSFMIR
ncbi:sigma-70 family RNA polymerase sigma factor [Mucilaginibacter sp. RS28]|uniref:Sigma-70 family RNA polymerase sigma factor n=1 Tax=Mucilaginibacter straminoryzae TaxID=2932774 RepID=A0A9X2BAJ6_9SPHI|nr:sigma-70 family RNA polymerase sigma factor [Mucilaginibacter straminoryzae]MCJ8208862.1 sigma-70 family RNA polymerase sigma factor [Mucilaginibacter straminoryzae]